MFSGARTDWNLESNNFLKDNKSNSVQDTIIGRRKREIGLVVTATYMAYKESKWAAETLENELAKIGKTFAILELKL